MRDLWMLAFVVLGGCPMGDGGSTAAVSGTVGRTAPLAAGGDGVGTLYVGVFEDCATFVSLGGAGVPDADLSSETARVPFAIADLPRSPVELAVFLDDDGDADPAAPLPDAGDLVYGLVAGDGVADCVSVDLSAGDVDDLEIELNLLEEEQPAAITGVVGRTAPIAPDGDGVGTLFVAAFDVCDLAGAILGVAAIPDADLAGDAAGVPFSIAGLPRTTVHLASFLDDDGNADPSLPLPDTGDLVYGEGAGDGLLDCVAVDLSAGDDDAVSFDLNLLEEAVSP